MSIRTYLMHRSRMMNGVNVVPRVQGPRLIVECLRGLCLGDLGSEKASYKPQGSLCLVIRDDTGFFMLSYMCDCWPEIGVASNMHRKSVAGGMR
mmetsp:Transcript_9064/g.14557  ORF Transcript_9064/g.14557 Transcript_9064/m.14557 type:complete len:94 (-) Transcript_9064:565-846(-)